MAILRSPQLRGVKDAAFEHNQVTGDVMQALAEADLSPELRILRLSGNPLGAIDINAVAELRRRHPDLILFLDRCDIPLATQQELARTVHKGVHLDRLPEGRRRTAIRG
jgi:hypothetical protein